MPRPLRISEGGLVHHVLNRSNAGMSLFDAQGDYEAFERVLVEARDRVPVRILSYCVMPNHWHFVLWPREDGDLSRFMAWLTMTHTQRWHACHGSVGSGHLYQGRFKSFLVQSDVHCLTVCRYAERNALRARLVNRAEDWRWCSLWRRVCGSPDARSLLTEGPVSLPPNWTEYVNEPQTEKELAALRTCVARSRPYGEPAWQDRMARHFRLSSAFRHRGRPRKRGQEPFF